MSIETRIPQEEINIAELSLSQPERDHRPLFDIENAITKEQWDGIIMKQLEANENSIHTENQIEDMLNNGVAIKLISEKKFQRVQLFKNDYKNVWETNVKKSGFEWGRMQTAGYLKIMYPEKDPRSGLHPDDKAWLLPRAQNPITKGEFNAAVLYKILYPEDATGDWLDFNDTKRGEVIERLKQLLVFARTNDRWDYFAMEAGEIKLLFPELVEQLGITKNDWQRMEKYIKTYQKDSTATSLPRFLAGIKILASDSATITENGIILTPPSTKNVGGGTDKPLPEIKKF